MARANGPHPKIRTQMPDAAVHLPPAFSVLTSRTWTGPATSRWLLDEVYHRGQRGGKGPIDCSCVAHWECYHYFPNNSLAVTGSLNAIEIRIHPASREELLV